MTYTIEAYYRHEHSRSPAIIASDDDADQLVDSLLGELSSTRWQLCMFRIARKLTRDGLKFAGVVNGTAGVWYTAGQSPQHGEVFYEYTGPSRGPSRIRIVDRSDPGSDQGVPSERRRAPGLG